MTVMGREDGWLSGGRDRVDQILKIASEPVVCVKKSHELTIGQLPASGQCPVCKREGVRSEVVLKSEAAEVNVRNREVLKNAGYDSDDEPESQGKRLNMMKSDDVVETGGTINWGSGSEPIVTKRAGNPRRGLWTGSR